MGSVIMNEFVETRFQRQASVNAYFRSQSRFWREVYADNCVRADIIRDRHVAVLGLIDDLALPPGSQVLEIGCGAGFMAVALAQRGFRVQAIDSVESMVELARQHAMEADLADRPSVALGDIYALAFADESFDLVLAIGVLPWIGRIEPAVREMARVTKPGGSVILTTANQAGLTSLLDPRLNPLLSLPKRYIKNILARLGLRQQMPGINFHGNRFIDKTLAHVGLVKTRGMTRGFEFSFFRRPVFSARRGMKLHRQLQRLVDRGVPMFHSIGMTYFVLARKTVSSPYM